MFPEKYFSRSKNQWLYVSDMSDMHVRRAFKRLLRMIRLGQLIELSDYDGSDSNKNFVKDELDSIIHHCEKIKQKISE